MKKGNKLIIIYVLLNLITSTLLRFLTIKNYFNLKPLIADLGVLIIIGSFSYLFKDKKKYYYLLIMTIIGSFICCANSVYYNNYLSFASISLIGSITFLKDVGNAVVDNIDVAIKNEDGDITNIVELKSKIVKYI